MDRIENLTAEQEAQIAVWLEKIWRTGNLTGPADREKVKAAMTAAYEMIGKPPPIFLFFDSPLSCCLAATILRNVIGGMNEGHRSGKTLDPLRAPLRAQLGDELFYQLTAQLSGELFYQLSDQIRNQLRVQLRDQIRNQLRVQLRDQLSDKLFYQLSDQIRNQLRDQLSDKLFYQIRGQISAQLTAQLSDELSDELFYQLRDQLTDELFHQIRGQISAPLRAQLGDELFYQLTAQLSDELFYQIRGQISAPLRGPLSDQLRDQLFYQLRDQLTDPLRAKISDPIRFSAQLRDQMNNVWHFGGHENYWVTFFSFMRDVLGVAYDEESDRKLAIHEQLCQSCGWIFPYSGVCLISDRPEQINWTKNGMYTPDIRLHCDGGPAVRYKDGFSMWCLNGVRVTREIAETPASELDPSEIMKITNAGVRMQAIQKVGMTRMASIARSIHREDDTYELIEMDLNDGITGRYLKMTNPSTGAIHIEGVANKCQTVSDALNFRKPESMRAIPVDDVHGDDFYQQGDVYFWPKDAKSLKSRPRQLT